MYAQLRLTLFDSLDSHQAPLLMGFPRQQFWSGLPFPTPGDLPDPGIEPTSLMSPALVGGFFTTSIPWEAAEEGQPHPEVRKSSLGRSTWLLRNNSWCVQFSEEHRLWHHSDGNVNMSFHFSEP